jgi:hypothetical protein
MIVDLKDRANAQVRDDSLFTIDELREVSPSVSLSVTVKLLYRKVCARWVPRVFTDEHKQKETVTDWLNGLAADFHGEGSSSLCIA